jgi:hypothetical protein
MQPDASTANVPGTVERAQCREFADHVRLPTALLGTTLLAAHRRRVWS